MEELNEVNRGVSQDAKWEAEPDNVLRRPFWILKLIRTTITKGGFITPNLHVPRLVWEQWGAKFSGLSIKTNAYEAILILLVDRILPLELLQGVNGDGQVEVRKAKQALQVFVGVRKDLDELQNNLSRPFPCIREVVSSSPRSTSSYGTAGAEENGTSIINMQQRFSTMVLSIGKTVKKSAISAYTAYERIGE